MACETPAGRELSPGDIFSCRQCGACCLGYGGTVVSPGEIQALATAVDTTPAHFVQGYCRPSSAGHVLAQGADGFCCFARDGRCTVHAVKPRMCRQWPFISSVLKAPENWYLMASVCPGMKTDVSPATVKRCVTEMLAADARRFPVS